MQNNTISDIINTVIAQNISTEPTKFEEKIIEMYNDTVSEEMYDTDEICTKICENYFNELDDCPDDVLACRLIYDIFNTCKNHVARINAEYDLKIAIEKRAHQSMDYLKGAITPRWAKYTSVLVKKKS